MVSPADSLVAASGGDYFLTLISFFVIGVFSLFTYLVYWITHDIPDKWEKSTDRLISKMCDVIKKQCDIEGQIKEHDKQASDIGEDVAEIRTTLRNRPCIMKK